VNILLVAPYHDLVLTARKHLQDFPYKIEIIEGDLEKGLQLAEEKNLESRVDIIVSRGGTAKLLQKNFSVPVFEIGVTGYDILRAIYPHANENKKVAVIGYENVIIGAKSISQILSIELGYFLLSNEKKIEETVSEALQFGAQVITGDTISVNTARKLGMQAELIRSGPEAIISAVEAAVQFHGHMQSEMLRNRRLNIIMEHSGQSILYLNSQNIIEMVNIKALKVLQITKEQLVGKAIDSEVVPTELREAITTEQPNKLITIADRDYMMEVRRIATDEIHAATLIFLQSSSRIKDLEDNLIKQLASRGLIATHSFDDIITKNFVFKKIIEKAKKYSETNSTILLLGETGSGKEMFAQSIHNASLRKYGPFVAVNCAALPDSLLESELFGYVEGAFTGAKKGGKTGLFEMAHKGTIFLDELNDMSKNVQARLLRVIQEKQVMRIGDDRVHTIDIRFIAASNKNLFSETEAGRFRKDLYYRLRVLDIMIPPLRERKDDIVPLFLSFIKHFSEKYGYTNQNISHRLISAIKSSQWPGNVRQLRNFAEKVSVQLSMNFDINEIESDLIDELSYENSFDSEETDDTFQSTENTLKEIETAIVIKCWMENNKNISKTAQQLGIDRATVRKYISQA